MTKSKTKSKQGTGLIVSLGYGTNAKTTPKAKREPGSIPNPEALLDIVRALGAVLVDCRAFPGPLDRADTMVNPKTGRLVFKSGKIVYVRTGLWAMDLAEALGRQYEYHGDTLGGLHGDAGGPTEAGMAMLVRRYEAGERLILMCSEATPGECHRHFAMSVPGRWPDGSALPTARPKSLAERGVTVRHLIVADGDADPLTLDTAWIFEATAYESFLRGKRKDYPAEPLVDFIANL